MNMDVLLAALVEQRARISSSRSMPPTLKVNGRLVSLGPAPLDKTTALALIRESLDETHFERFLHTREANYAIQRGSLGRFRVSAFWQQDMPGMVLRRIETRIPTFDELVLPPILQEVAMAKRGLVLFVGATGAGKSTTQAAMIGFRNQHGDGHILTVEDPVEFVHQHDRCLVTQREVGIDTASFDVALKTPCARPRMSSSSVKSAPRRPWNSPSSSPRRGTSASPPCTPTMPTRRWIASCIWSPGEAPPVPVRSLLQPARHRRPAAAPLRSRAAPGRRLRDPAQHPLVTDIIRKGEMHRLKEVMTKSGELGMQTFDQALFGLFCAGQIGYSEALAHADSANDLRLLIKLSGREQLGAGTLDNVTLDE